MWNEGSVFACLLVAALGGWAWFITRMASAVMEMAKAFEIAERVGARIDQRTAEFMAMQAKRIAKAQENADTAKGGGPRILDDEAEMAFEAKRLGIPLNMYGGPPTDEEGTGLPEMPMPVEG
jgi:hypothetical protein